MENYELGLLVFTQGVVALWWFVHLEVQCAGFGGIQGQKYTVYCISTRGVGCLPRRLLLFMFFTCFAATGC